MNEKISTSRRKERLSHNLTIHPNLGTEPYKREGTFNSQLIPEELREKTKHLAPQLLGLPSEGWAPQTLTLSALVPQDLANQDVFFKGLIYRLPVGHSTEGAGESVFPGRGLMGPHLTTCCLRVWHGIRMSGCSLGSSRVSSSCALPEPAHFCSNTETRRQDVLGRSLWTHPVPQTL